MIKSANARDLVWVLGMLLGVLCGCPQQMEQPDTSAWSTCEAPEIAPPPEQVTYHQHIKPMMQTYCVGCHYDGGPSPFALQTYEQVKQHQVAAQWAISTGSMPPWFASDCCREYANDISLPADQQALFEQWIAQGATEGVPASLPKAPRAEPAPGEQQVVLKMPEAWETGRAGRDFELRCMLLDWPEAQDVFITSFGAKPGNRAIVHHILASIVPPSRVAEFQARDDADDGLGWDCYGEGGNPTNVQLIGGWVPGMDAVSLPEGVGMKVPRGSKILFEVHYDLSASKGADQTTFTFNTASKVDTEAKTLTMAHPLWLIGDGMHLPAGEVTSHDVRTNLSELYGYDEPVVLYGTSIHMHELGVGGTVALQRADGSWECLLQLTDFEFGWQGLYYFKEPVTIHPGDTLYLSCQWDNRAQNQPDGREPVDLQWGTDGEMCSAFLLVAK